MEQIQPMELEEVEFSEEELKQMSAEIEYERNMENAHDIEVEERIANGEKQCEDCCEWFPETELSTVLMDEAEEYNLCEECKAKSDNTLFDEDDFNDFEEIDSDELTGDEPVSEGSEN